MKFPKKLKYRGKVLARIYAKTKAHGYQLYWRVWENGKPKSRLREFKSYAEAKREGEEVVRELAQGSQTTTLTHAQANDALAAFERLDRFFRATGKRVSLLASVSVFCEASAKVNGVSVDEAIERYNATVAVVKRKALKEAVAEFVEGRKHLGESKNGERSRRSPVYLYNVAMWLNEFATTLPGHAVCDVTKDHLDIYIGKFNELSAKSRNDRRATVKMFLRWCAAKDFLPQNHRLFEAVGFKTEDEAEAEIDFYRPTELRDMLDRASRQPKEGEQDYRSLVPVLALGGLAGLRREEIMRLDWADVWRVRGKVEIGARIAKGRKRRLVDICPALAEWLRPYRDATGPVWGKSPDILEEGYGGLRDSVGVPARRNGMRHSFITFHMALHANENLTAAECGNSPQMIHDQYRALATRRDALNWFGVRPSRAASNVIQLQTKATK